ncbi:MAG: hypothetical protein KGY75_10095 [Candidatus Cloacimonetes bacterium]|nr:hypothetical protein [Candidatus Cloacimonadota bacterium]MBS3768452.1 hypothetical protein [Candidatus Cloacimonadota bacterium]
MIKKNISNQCIKKINSLEPIKKVRNIKFDFDKKNHYDGELEILQDDDKFSFIFEIKTILKRPIPEKLYKNKKVKDKHFIIFAEYVNRSIAEDLKKIGVNYIDCQGNVYLKINNKLYIELQGNKFKKSEDKKTSAIFQPKGLQLLLLLLINENFLNFTIRKLAQMSGISLGRTVTIIKELKEKGYVFEIKKNKFKFANKKRIVEKWIENYNLILRPKLFIGTYRISPKRDIVDIRDTFNQESINFAFGGDTGGELLTDYYRAGCKDIYIEEENCLKVSENLNLIKAEDYNLRLFNLYSKEIIYKFVNGNPVVLPLLIYAELLSSKNKRAKKTAKIIYDNYIKDKIV